MSANANLYTALRAGFPSNLDQIAIETPRHDYTWKAIDTISAQLANLLRACNPSAGARVAVQVEKSPETLLLYLATLRAGLVYLPLNNAYQESELNYFLQDAEPEIVICDPDAFSWCKPLADQCGVKHVFTLDADGKGSLIEAAASQDDVFETAVSKPDDLAAILYTSGTTGHSKGAMLTHDNLISNARTLHQAWGWRNDDVLLHMLPVFHVHGLFVAAHGALMAGARMIWLPRLNLDEALHYLPRCTVMMGVPTYYVRLLGETRFTRELCTNMRLFVSGSAPLLTETFNAFYERTGHKILERYGMSETVMNTSNPYLASDGERLPGTVGRPLPDIQIRVVDDNGLTVPTGTPGNIQVSGPNVFCGYWRMPEKTAQEFTHDGWFQTGDIGTFGGEGIPDDYLSIIGRSKDLIITGGYNVYPKEIELLIDKLPGVIESAVIGVSHPDFGEAVVALIVPHADLPPDVKQIRTHLQTRLANFKVPKKLLLIDELPRNTMGKVQKNLLREQYGKLYS